MGTIYLARDTLVERNAALKLISNPGLGTDRQSRVLAEAKALAKKTPKISCPSMMLVRWNSNPIC